MRFALSLGTMTAVALMGSPLLAQHDDHGMRRDSATAGTQHGCPMSGMHMGMMGAADTAHMRGMPGMMGMMTPDSAMMATMRFAPRYILTHGDSLDLTSEQLRKIEVLATDRSGGMPMHGMAGETRAMRMDTTHMNLMRETAAAVRDLLTPEQQARVTALPAPCGMMDPAKASGHDAHHRQQR